MAAVWDITRGRRVGHGRALLRRPGFERLERRRPLASDVILADPPIQEHTGPSVLTNSDELVADAALQAFVPEALSLDRLSALLTPAGMPLIDVTAFEDDSISAVWTSMESGNSGVFVQRLGMDGNVLSSPTQVAALAPGTTFGAPVRAVTLATGDSVIVWADALGLRGLWFDKSDLLSGSAFTVETSGSTGDIDVVATPDGGFVVVWSDSFSGVLGARSYNATAVAHGPVVTLVGDGVGKVQAISHDLADYAVAWAAVGTAATEVFYSPVINGALVNPLDISAPNAPLPPRVAVNSRGEFATVHGERSGGDELIVIRLWGSDGTLHETITADSYTGPATTVAPTIQMLDGGGFSIVYVTTDAVDSRLWTQVYNSNAVPIRSPTSLTNFTKRDVAFLESKAAPKWGAAIAWIGSDPMSGDITVSSSSFRPSFTPLTLEQINDIPGLSAEEDFAVGLRGLGGHQIGAGTLENDAWLVRELDADFLAIFSDEELPAFELGFDFYDPQNVTTPLHQDTYLFGSLGADKLSPTAGVKAVDGRGGDDRLSLVGDRNQYQWAEGVALDEYIVASTLSSPQLVRSVGRASFANIALPLDWLAEDRATLVDDQFVGYEDQILASGTGGVLSNDSLTHLRESILIQAPANGSLEFKGDGRFAYTPVEEFTGVDSFSYDTRLRFWDNADPTDNAGLTTSSTAWGVLEFSSIPVALEVGGVYRLELLIDDSLFVDSDAVLSLDGSGSLIANETGSDRLAGQFGYRSYDFTKSAVDTRVEFQSVGAGQGAFGEITFSQMRLTDIATGEILASTEILDGLPASVQLTIIASADTPAPPLAPPDQSPVPPASPQNQPVAEQPTQGSQPTTPTTPTISSAVKPAGDQEGSHSQAGSNAQHAGMDADEVSPAAGRLESALGVPLEKAWGEATAGSAAQPAHFGPQTPNSYTSSYRILSAAWLPSPRLDLGSLVSDDKDGNADADRANDSSPRSMQTSSVDPAPDGRLDLTRVYFAADALEQALLHRDEPKRRMLAGSAVVLAVGFSASQLAWLLRGSLVLTKAISSAPLCFSFDPLPVLDAHPFRGHVVGDGESLADIVTHQETRS